MKNYHMVLYALTVWSIAVSSFGDTFFLLDNDTNELITGNVANPAATAVVGALGDGYWGELATGIEVGEVLAVEIDYRTIYRLDTKNANVIDSVVVDRDVRNLAYDPGAGVLYGLPQYGPIELFTIDLATGDTNVIGLTGIPEETLCVPGMGFDPVTGNLFATTSCGIGDLYSIETDDAHTTLVGNYGLDSAFDIAYNFVDGELYITDADTDSLYRIDRHNANAVLIGGPYADSTLATGLAFQVPEPATGALSAVAILLALRRR